MYQENGIKRRAENNQEIENNFEFKKQRLDNDLQQEELNGRLRLALLDNDIDAASEAINQGADVNYEHNSGYGCTFPMIHLVKYENFAIYKLLISHGADINSRNYRGSTVLFKAASNDKLETVKFLLGHGAKINLPDNSNVTPLYIAACRGNVEMVKFLVENGADINVREKIGGNEMDTPWSVAYRQQYAGDGNRDKYLEIMEYLRSCEMND